MQHPALAAGGMTRTLAACGARWGRTVAPIRRELIRFARGKLSAGIAPREIDFLDTMPKTRSGKIMRRLLKARELGEPEGDISTLEDD